MFGLGRVAVNKLIVTRTYSKSMAKPVGKPSSVVIIFLRALPSM